MDIKGLLKSLADMDEMECQCGMNVAESVEEENEKAENKRKLKVYVKAYEALEELQDILEEDIDLATSRMSKQTELFYDKLTEMIDEIYSKSLAFEE